MEQNKTDNKPKLNATPMPTTKPVETAKEKKNASWNFINGNCVVTFPDKSTASFDSKVINSDALKYYGLKQILSDCVANEPVLKDKIQGMRDWYKEAVEKGIEITETGKISIIGKVRANSKPRTADGVVEDKIATMTKEEAKSALYMVSLGAVKFSQEVLDRITEKAK
jgi:hypothetical protein